MCFKDDFSKFRRLFFLKRKSEVHGALETFLNEAKTNGHIAKVLRSDGGGEFVNKKIADLLASRGIEHHVTPPYTPEQNGVNEKENRTIVEVAKSMLRASQLPKALWAETCKQATNFRTNYGTEKMLEVWITSAFLEPDATSTSRSIVEGSSMRRRISATLLDM